MYGTEIEENRTVVFDVSLLAPEAQELVSALLEEGNFTFIATPLMLRVFKEIDKYRGLLRLWGIDTRYAELISKFLYKVEFFERVKPISVEDLPEREFLGLLKGLIRERNVGPAFEDFLAEEMCLAIAGYPILCIAGSRWKIVEFFEKVGAKVKKVIHMRVREKGEMLRTRKFRNMVLAKGLGAALVYAFGGPIAALTNLGAEAIKLIIVDG